MHGRYFIDTTIFIYTFDKTDKHKHKKANEIVAHALDNLTGVTSCQVIQEFFNAATTRFKIPLSLADCHKYLTVVLEPLCEVHSNVGLYHLALEIIERWQFPFQDALIVSAAMKAECKILYSEDLPHLTKIQNLTIINPFLV